VVTNFVIPVSLLPQNAPCGTSYTKGVGKSPDSRAAESRL